MVQKHSVYRKSTQAAEALARRDHSLAPRLRSLLILVDGKRPVEELVRIAPTGSETEQLLAQLEGLGLLEIAPASGEPAPAPSASAPHTIDVAPTPAVPLAEAKRAAVRKLTDLLGPEAESLCLRIESTRTAHDLLAMLQRAESLVRSARGGDAANAFTQHMRAYRPA